MTRRRAALTFMPPLVAMANLAATVAFQPPLLVVSVVSTSCVATVVVNMLILKRGLRNGSNRQAQADSQDSYSVGETGLESISVGSSYYAINPYSFTITTGSGANPVAPPPPELEVVEGDVPILAHRSALLRFDGTSNPFASVNTNLGVFGVDTKAHCARPILFGSDLWAFQRYKTHAAPGVGCECGFYALPPDMRSTYEGHNYVTLMVELSGTVIEHEQGYRAEHQRVVECQLPACCYCGGQAEVVLIEGHIMQEATCIGHCPKLADGQVVIEVAALSKMLPVPVTRAGRVEVPDVR